MVILHIMKDFEQENENLAKNAAFKDQISYTTPMCILMFVCVVLGF